MTRKKAFCFSLAVVVAGGLVLCASLSQGKDPSQLLDRYGTISLPPGTPGGVASDGTNFLIAQRRDNGELTAMFVSSGPPVLLQTTDLVRTGGVPRVAFDGARYLMIWPDVGEPPADIYGQFLHPSGTPAGSPFLIEADAGVVEAGGLAFDGANYLAVWGSNAGNTSSVSTVHGRLISPAGTLVGSRIQISEADTAQRFPAVAASRDHFLVIWTGESEATNSWSVLGRGVGRDGTPAQSVAISEVPAQQPWPPTVASDGTNWLAVWSRESGPFPVLAAFPSNMWMPMLHGRVVAADLTAPAPEFGIRRAGQGAFLPAAAFSGTNYLVSWLEQHRSVYWNYVGQLDSSGQPVTTELRTFYNVGSTNPLGLALGYAAGQGFSVWRLENSTWTFGQSVVRVNFNKPVLRNFKLLPSRASRFDITGEIPARSISVQDSTNLTDWSLVPDPNGNVLTRQGTFTALAPSGGGGVQRFFRTLDGRAVCIDNLRLIDRAKAQWALENKKTSTDYPTPSDLFGEGKYYPEPPVCPHGGVYYLQPVVTFPTCSFGAVGGHTY